MSKNYIVKNCFLETKNPNRNYFLDFLKVIAMVLVLVWHSFHSKQSLIAQYGFAYFVSQGVPIFLLISSYLMTMSWEHGMNHSFKKIYYLKKIILRMIHLILPFLLFFITEETIVMCINQQWDYKILINFKYGGIGPGNYFVPIILQFTIIFPFIFIVIKKFKIYGLLGCLLFNTLYEILTWACIPYILYWYLIFRYIFIIASGCFIYLSLHDKFKWQIAIPSFIVGIVWMSLALYTKLPIVTTSPDYPMLIPICCFGSVWLVPLLSLLIKNTKFNKQWFWSFISKATYNIFLFQMIYYSLCYSTFQAFSQPYFQMWLDILINFVFGWLFWFGEHFMTNALVNRINVAWKIK